MEAELKRIAKRGLKRPDSGVRARRIDEQTLVYPFDRDLAYLAVHYLRTPSRALWDVYVAEAGRLEPLYDEVLEWIRGEDRGWFWNGAGLSVRARDVRAFPASASQIQGTIKNALIDGAAERGITLRLEPESPDLLISVRGTGGVLVISVDLSGRSMHERGYRLDRTEAPLRENLAAQILMLSRWDARSEALIDPMCGSGTFPIEAAAMAIGAPLWRPPIRPAADRLPEFASCLAEPRDLFPGTRPVIVGNDVHTPAIDAARKNLARSGMSEHVMLLHGDFRDLSLERIRRTAERSPPAAWPSPPPLERGLVVCNPPYGERLGGDIEALYRDLRDWIRGLGDGWRAALLVEDPDLERIFGQARMKKPLANGPLKTQLYVFD